MQLEDGKVAWDDPGARPQTDVGVAGVDVAFEQLHDRAVPEAGLGVEVFGRSDLLAGEEITRSSRVAAHACERPHEPHRQA